MIRNMPLYQVYPVIYKHVNPENSFWKYRKHCLTSFPDKQTIRCTHIQKIPLTENKGGYNETNTSYMHDNDGDTAHSPDT